MKEIRYIISLCDECHPTGARQREYFSNGKTKEVDPACNRCYGTGFIKRDTWQRVWGSPPKDDRFLDFGGNWL